MSLKDKFLTFMLILTGLLGSVGFAFFLLQSQAYWLHLSSALLLALIAWWQTPCIKVALNHSAKPTTEKRTTAIKKTKHFPCLKHWLIRLSVYCLLVSAVVLSEALWWTIQPLTMNAYKEEKTQSLPYSYALKRPLWQLGIKTIPELVEIPAGQFTMGSETGDSNEKPVHNVVFQNSFLMSSYEITFAQYDYYIWSMHQQTNIINLQKPGDKIKINLNYPYDEGWGRGTLPVINVSWHDAQGYSNWLSKNNKQGLTCRLPSEAEWEYAARANSKTKYFWGDEIGQNNANCDGCGSQWDGKQTAPAGSFKANDWGLYDMHGNVYEWVQDCYQNYDSTSNDGSVRDKAQCGGRVLRGGSWLFYPEDLRSAYRYFSLSVVRYDFIGFRVVCSHPSTDH